MIDKRKLGDRIGIFACYLMAITALAVAIYHIYIILPILEKGERTPAEVIEIHTGVKSSKWPVYQFTTKTGEQITERDLFQLYFIRLHKGDKVTVIYDPDNPRIVTADLGLWIWQGTGIFLISFLFLATLGVFILRYKSKRKE